MQIQLSLLLFIWLPLLSILGFNGTGYAIAFIPSLLSIIWPKKIFFIGASILNLFFFGLLSFELLHFLVYGTLPTPGVYIAIFGTDWNETQEFLISQDLTFISLIYIFLIVISVLVGFKGPRITKKVAASILGICVLLTLTQLIHIHRRSPLKLITYYHHYLKEIDDFKLRLSIQKNAPITINENISPKDHTVVFVLGESITKNRMSLYGYERLTTPQLARGNDLLVFKNIVSPHTQTYSSLRKVLTLLNSDNEKSLKNNTHIINLAKAARYRTYWISNQRPMGKFENPHTVIAQMANETYWLNDGIESSEAQYDERVLKPLTRVLQKKANKKFIVIHLLGAHTAYKNRYPNSFDVFKDTFPSLKLKLSQDENQIYNEYDNAVLYQDYVLASILKTLKTSTRNYSFIYFPDHGEEALQDARIVGHTEANATKNMYEIPMLFASSDLNLAEQAKMNLMSEWNTEDFIHTLHSILMIRTQYYEKNRDILTKEGPPERALGKN